MLSDRMLIDASYVAVNPSDNWLQLWLHWVRCRYGGCMQNKAPSSQNTCFWQKRPPTTAAMVSMANLWPSFEMREMKGFAGQNMVLYGYGSIPINTIFRGMNIHLPAILMFTRGTRFWHTAIWFLHILASFISIILVTTRVMVNMFASRTVQVGWGELVDTADTKIGRGDVLLVVDMQHFDCSISHGQLGYPLVN